MMETWDQIWEEIRTAAIGLPRCPNHPEFPCVRTLRRPVINDITHVDLAGIWVKSHISNKNDKISVAAFRRWWSYLQQNNSASLNPGDENNPRSMRSVLVGAILVACLPDRIAFDGSDSIRMKAAHATKDAWGYRLQTGAAAINQVLLESKSALSEDEIIALVKQKSLTERGAV
jgi:hypothetical protein